MAKHAGAISTHAGDLRRASGYYERACSNEPDDAHLHFALGDIYRLMGRNRQARESFARSGELARQQGDTDLAESASRAADELAD
jgi:Flp pilus assembly protein TadD